LLSTAIVALALWSWGKWPDPLVDFGRELYVPWQLAQGKSLYLDLAYFNGPLSPHLNGLLFKLFGSSLRVLVVANLSIIALLTCLIYQLLRRCGDRLTAASGALVFLSMFAFAQFIYQGNFNFVTPYSHEMTHATLLSALALWSLAKLLESGDVRAALGMGTATGLVFFTKPEFLVALLPATAIPLVFLPRLRAGEAKWRTRIWTAYGLGLVLPVAIGGIVLRLTLPVELRTVGFLGGWLHVFNRDLSRLTLYRDIMGTAELPLNLRQTASWLTRWLAVFGLALAASYLPRRSRRGTPPLWLQGVTLLVFAGLMLIRFETVEWQHAIQPLPLVLIAVSGVLVARVLDRRTGANEVATALLELSVVVFSLLLLLKMIFRVRLAHYGFALALPATLVLVVVLLEGLPRWVGRHTRGSPEVFRAACLGIVAGVVAVHLYATHTWFQLRTVEVGRGADAFLADSRGVVVNDVLADLDRLSRPGETLAVVSEGVMINYLARMENPTPFVNFMPPEFIMFGEPAMLEAFADRPPDWIVVTDRKMPEYGMQGLGFDYGRELIAWIERHYRLAGRVVAENPSPYGLRFAMILERLPPSGTAGIRDEATD
jgi:hypothetical protein